MRPPCPPEGFETKPSPWRYRIRRVGDTATIVKIHPLIPRWEPSDIVEEHQTVDATRWVLGDQRHIRVLAPEDQAFADEITMLIQRACHYFYKPDEEYEPMEGVADIIVTDAEVLERVEALDKGENTRESVRSGKQRYPLTELPFDQQRALIEQIEAWKAKWSFVWLGESIGPDAESTPVSYGV